MKNVYRRLGVVRVSGAINGLIAIYPLVVARFGASWCWVWGSVGSSGGGQGRCWEGMKGEPVVRRLL